MSHFVAYILQFQEIIVYKIPPGGGGGSIASLCFLTYYAERMVLCAFLFVRVPFSFGVILIMSNRLQN